MNKNLGLYLHYPFCVRKCQYCDFLSFPSNQETRREYREALLKEIRDRAKKMSSYTVDTIFFGGGTPSLLDGREMQEIISAIKSHFSISENYEFTVECNPGTVTADKLAAYRECGVNRLSFGLQSVISNELRALGRIHSYEDFLLSYQQAEQAGFTNINVDLMSGIPFQTRESFRKSCQMVLELEPAHISAYSLIIEEGTPFYSLYSEHPPVDEDTDRQMYADTKQIMKSAGFDRYEISNYARPGYECRHNLKYWSGDDYLGIGLGAASLVNHTRFSNERKLEKYLSEPNCMESVQHLSEQEQMEEFMFLGLRKCSGVRISEFELQFQSNLMDEYGDVIQKYIKLGMLAQNEDALFLTESGIDVSNVILAEFLK